ncbi:MAG TPA: flagellar brake protein [Gammaproteobacteria bacterium]|nr:flagellar brake protein [Gammaproteobacteria bacterium]
MDNTSQLELGVGDSLQLQVVADERKHRHYAKVIGYLRDYSFLITTPRVNGNIIFLHENQMVNVRMMAGNQVCGFSTLISRVCLKPYPYLHLAYPKEMEHVTIRKAQRVATRLMATAKIGTSVEPDSSSYSVVIRDISASGVMIDVDRPLGDIGGIITLSIKFEVAGLEESISLRTITRNIIPGEGDQKCRMGLEFELLEVNEHMVIHGYMYEQMILKMKK